MTLGQLWDNFGLLFDGLWIFFRNQKILKFLFSRQKIDKTSRPKSCERNWKMPAYFGKGGFFSESAIRFSELQISKKKNPKSYPELEI
jgi:hypothetical protein